MSTWADQIEEDLRWREAELAVLKVQILKCTPGSSLHSALLRSYWVMIYAHYEGFCKFAWDLYLDAIMASQAKHCDVVPELDALAMHDRFNRLKNSASHKEMQEFFDQEWQVSRSAPIQFPYKYEKISNLPPDILAENCAKIGLPSTMCVVHNSRLKKLVSDRHQIAHGQKLLVGSLSHIEPFREAAWDAMIEIGVGVVDYLDHKLYLRATTSDDLQLSLNL